MRWRPTLAGQFLVLQLIVVALVLAAVSIVSLRQSTAEFRDERGSRVRGAAENLANRPIVRDRIAADDAPRVLASVVDQAESLSGSSIVQIARPSGRIISSSDPRDIGDRMDLSASNVREGRAWSGDISDDGRRAIAGHVPVLDDRGRLAGIVMVGDDYPSLWQQVRSGVPDLLLFVLIGASLGVLGSGLLARLIKRRTRGLEPAQIATLADHREALLHSIREGVIGIGVDGTITVLNDSACELLGLPSSAVGRSIHDVDLDAEVRAMLLSPDDARDATVVTPSRVLVLNRRGASSEGESIGSVTTLRDRTELASLQSQLTSNRNVTETLRAQTHEFANQLHTISGLVQLGEYDDVNELIGALTRRRAALSDTVTSHVRDPAVAALLIAKTSLAAESGIELVLDPGSRLDDLPVSVSADVTTVLGNLVDNAVYASAHAHGRVVRVELSEDGHALRIRVSDSGPGVPSGLRDSIFSRGVSTKPDVPGGRGFGLALVRMVCARRGGEVSVDNDNGAVFTATLPYDRSELDRD